VAAIGPYDDSIFSVEIAVLNRRHVVSTLTAAEAVFAALGGVAAGFAFTHRPWGFLLWLVLTPLFGLLWRRPLTWRRGAAIGGIWGAGFFLASYRFMTALHSLEWLGLSQLASVAVAYGLAWILLSLVSALGLAVWGGVIGYIRPSGWSRIWVPAAAWMVWEYAQRLGPFAMPWNVLALSQVGYPAFLQISAFVGSAAVAGLIVMVNAGLAAVWADWRKGKWHSWRYAALPLVLAVGNAVWGIAFLGAQPPSSEGSLKVGVVQGNVRPDVKWQPGALRDIWQVYKRLSEAVATDGVSLIVWPETALPVPLDRYPAAKKALGELTARTQVPVLVGAIDEPEPAPGTAADDRTGPFNGAALFRENGARSGWYHKRHLVPFGEYTPGGGLLTALGVGLNALPEDVQPGTTAGVIPMGGLRLGPMICYESLFPALAADSVRAGADVLVVITNDGWYKRSSALYQHLGQAALRAVETHRPVVRAANTGISALIDPFGRISAETPIDARTTLTGAVSPRSELTPYVRWGDWLILVSLLALVGRGVAGIWIRE
jgi:apolipoprotein N-acyltransferase